MEQGAAAEREIAPLRQSDDECAADLLERIGSDLREAGALPHGDLTVHGLASLLWARVGDRCAGEDRADWAGLSWAEPG